MPLYPPSLIEVDNKISVRYTVNMKTCSRCGVEQPLSDYHFDKRYNKPRSYCKSCQREMGREWRAKNADKVREANKRYALTHKLKHKYNLTEDEYRQALEDSKGRCQICCKERKLFIDHCHETGKFRGLICSQCNSALGLMEDSVDRLQSAQDYLKAHMV